MTNGLIGSDWRADFSTVFGAQKSGYTRVTFHDPYDLESVCSEEVFLDGLTIEELHWARLSKYTYREVKGLEAGEAEDPGSLRNRNKLYKLLMNIKEKPST